MKGVILDTTKYPTSNADFLLSLNAGIVVIFTDD